MKIDRRKFGEEIGLFIARLATTPQARQAMVFAENNAKEKLLAMVEKTGHPLERVLLTALCGELKSSKEQAEFVTRLILLNILVDGT
jgi:hypothetical protein